MRLFRKFRKQRKVQVTPPIRNTTRDWEIIGANEPFYGVLTDERFRSENLNEQAIEDFYRTGHDAIAMYLRKMQALGPFEPRSALDFGCGVGRLSIPLTHTTGCTTGVDVSPGMIAEAQKHAPDGLTFASEIPDGSFDWVVSIIVFQHIPPERGLVLLHQLLARLSPHGGVTIQIMFARTDAHRGSPGERTLIRPDRIETSLGYSPGGTSPDGIILMHDYDMSVVLAELFIAGIKNLAIEYCDHGGHIGATFFGIKGQ